MNCWEAAGNEPTMYAKAGGPGGAGSTEANLTEDRELKLLLDRQEVEAGRQSDVSIAKGRRRGPPNGSPQPAGRYSDSFEVELA